MQRQILKIPKTSEVFIEKFFDFAVRCIVVDQVWKVLADVEWKVDDVRVHVECDGFDCFVTIFLSHRDIFRADRGVLFHLADAQSSARFLQSAISFTGNFLLCCNLADRKQEDSKKLEEESKNKVESRLSQQAASCSTHKLMVSSSRWDEA
jgi:hypothetical protein